MEDRRLTDADSSPPSDEVEAALALARDQLDMELAFLGEVVDGREVVRAMEGDASSFGFARGASVDLSATVCGEVLSGRVEGLLPHAGTDERTCSLSMVVQARIGAYVGVPLTAADARQYMLCCLAHESRPTLGAADLRFLRGLGETVLAALERERGAPTGDVD